ncbi:fungal-specific transcription factor domain-containing protein [Calycina marina]|uniref:Fungal-specific transcription factor domain-containing protein n=1 Tax=Calycina marina TaxID=1763456 RepID=A0A9P7Z5Q4_9HELO|nr:fungal-specific transcription factor domain-containing protein [Calycina marina]
MTPTPPSTTSSSTGAQSPDAQFRVVRKRNRVPLSCGPCRHRKLKCNRANPCDNCVRRGDVSSCSYVSSNSRKKNQSQAATSPDDMQNRIDRLEGLVLSLMTNGATAPGPAAANAAITYSQSDNTTACSYPPDLDHGDDQMIKEGDNVEESDVEGISKTLGTLKVDAERGKSFYFGDSHWNMVLADIAEVKTYFAAHKKDLDKKYVEMSRLKPSTDMDGPAFLFNSNPTITDAELRAEMPSKSSVDKLVARYFNSYDPIVFVVHAPTFHQQLRIHWQNPASTSIVWLGLLYAIMTLAMQSYNKVGDEDVEWKGRALELAAEYRLRTVQCLINSDYTKSSEFTIETLALYVHGEYFSRWDAEVGLWIVVGMMTRLAMRMGYHRDPSNFPTVSPFQGEMRRRIWAYIRQIDVMFSFQLALPSGIRNSDCDAAAPRNLFDDEFGPDTTVLPPSRISNESTPIAYMITKSQITHEFGIILEEINAVGGKKISYEDVMKHDSNLRNIRADIPSQLKLRPIEQYTTHEPAYLFMQRYGLDILWQKSMCVLHRKYIARARTNQRYAHSRRSCVDASLEILRHQAQLRRETEPGGRLRTMGWAISSLTKHDYLLAAMIVCLDLHYDSTSEAASECPASYKYFWAPAQRQDMLQLLETSRSIWIESQETSMEAYKASHIIGVMLETIKAPKAPKAGATAPEVFTQFDQGNLKTEHSAALTTGMVSGGLSPNSAAMFNNMGQLPRETFYQNSYDVTMGDFVGTGLTPNFTGDMGNPYAPLNNMPSPFSGLGNPGAGTGFENPDWDAWDTYIQSGIPVDPGFQLYSNNLDQCPNSDAQCQNQNQNQNQNQIQQQSPNFGDGVFMGENTPGR